MLISNLYPLWCLSLFDFELGMVDNVQSQDLSQCNPSFPQTTYNTGSRYPSFFFAISKIIVSYQDLSLSFTRDASFKKIGISQIFISRRFLCITLINGDLIFLDVYFWAEIFHVCSITTPKTAPFRGEIRAVSFLRI